MKIEYRDDSLVITALLCEVYGANKEGIEYIQTHYPKGFTPKDVLEGKTKYIPSYYINWGYHNLPFTESDKQRYKDYRHIVNCNSFYMSNDIKGGSYIVDSSFVENSNYIKNSISIFDSNYVQFGESIDHSEFVIRSSDITQSKFVHHSSKIMSSHYSFDCDELNFCDYTINCSKISECMLCRNIHNKQRCILCCGEFSYDETKYYFLNKEINEKIYKRLKEQISRYLESLATDEFILNEFNNDKMNFVSFSHNLFSDFYLFLKDIYPNYTDEDKITIASILFVIE